MKISDEHLYHGAVLNQIAKHPRFTAINALKVKGEVVSRSAFKVNNDIGVYLKISRTRKGIFGEYRFTFNQQHVKELRHLAEAGNDLHLALICVEGRDICCLTYKELTNLLEKHRTARSREEDPYRLLIALEPRKAFRVYMNQRGRRGYWLGDPMKIPRNRCPDILFRK